MFLEEVHSDFATRKVCHLKIENSLLKWKSASIISMLSFFILKNNILKHWFWNI